MKAADRDYILFLEDILISINRINEYLKDLDFPQFKKDYKTVDAVIRNFEIIGEAAKNVPQAIKDKYPNMPWKEMYRLRNRVSHEYFGINYEVIWDVSVNYLPENLKDLAKIIEAEENNRK